MCEIQFLCRQYSVQWFLYEFVYYITQYLAPQQFFQSQRGKQILNWEEMRALILDPYNRSWGIRTGSGRDKVTFKLFKLFFYSQPKAQFMSHPLALVLPLHNLSFLTKCPSEHQPQQGDFTSPRSKLKYPRTFQTFSPGTAVVGAILLVGIPQHPQSMLGYSRQPQSVFYQRADRVFPLCHYVLEPISCLVGWWLLFFVPHCCPGLHVWFSDPRNGPARGRENHTRSLIPYSVGSCREKMPIWSRTGELSSCPKEMSAEFHFSLSFLTKQLRTDDLGDCLTTFGDWLCAQTKQIVLAQRK